MDNLIENIVPSVNKFTSECIPVGKHGVVDLNNEREVVDAYKSIQKFLATEVSKTGAMNFTPAQMEHAQRGRAKAKQELNELKPYINPTILARLDAEFRELSREAQNLSEQRRVNMDKKIDEGFDEAISEFMDLAGICPDEETCEDVDFDSCFDIPCDEEPEVEVSVEIEPEKKPELSDEMGMELKDNKENELDESIRDFLPKAGAFRDESGKMIGGFIGNGSKDRIEKAKKIAKAKFYNGDRMGRVSDEEIDNFDEVYADLMRRAGMEPEELDEAATVEYQPDMLDPEDFDDRFINGREDADWGEINKMMERLAPGFFFEEEFENKGDLDYVFIKDGTTKEETLAALDRVREAVKERYGNDIKVSARGKYTTFKIILSVVNPEIINKDESELKSDYRNISAPSFPKPPKFKQEPKNEAAQPKSYLKPINETTAGDEKGKSKYFDVKDFDFELPEENPVDEIRMDVPLFMRCLEFAREDAQDDMDLHHLVEKATELSKDGKVLNMDNYDELSGGKSEEAIDESKDPNADTKMKPVKKATLKEGCSGKRKWKRIEKKSAVSEARRYVPYKLTVKQFNRLVEINRMAKAGDEAALDFLQNRNKIYDTKAGAKAAFKQKYANTKFADWISIEEDTGF